MSGAAKCGAPGCQATDCVAAPPDQAMQRRERDRIWRLAPLLMVVGDEAGTLLEVNPAWTKVLGWTAEETIGRNVLEFVAPEDIKTGADGMAELFQGRPVIEYQNSFVTRTGERRRIAWTTVPEDGRLHGYGRDVTDQVLAEARLRQAQKMEAIGLLTGGLAHDFNNLLTGIGGAVELLQMRAGQGRVEDLDRFANLALGAVRRAAELTQRLLAFSCRQALTPCPTDINLLMRGLEERIRQAAGPGLAVDLVLAPHVWTIFVDPQQLECAVINLCLNARDAMPGGGSLRIETGNRSVLSQDDGAKGDYVCLTVTDTGHGMSPEVLARAFDPFFTTRQIGDGTGLGLSMVYGFARQSGGQVVLKSAQGEGTSAEINLPRHECCLPTT